MANSCKFQKIHYQVSYDSGATWEDVVPTQFAKGELLEYDSPDCSGIDVNYRWRVLEGQYICDGKNKYTKEIQEESYNNGITWYTTFPTVYRQGQYVGEDAEFCCDKFVGHYVPIGAVGGCPKWYKWNGYRCVYVDPLKIVKCDGNGVLTSADTKYYANDYTMISAEIGNSVTSIGDYAFRYCSGLTSINIPSGVTSIGDYAFRYCISLTSIDIPNSVTSIGSDAFSDCSSLTSCTIGSGVTSIGEFAFSDCTSLTSIDIPSGVTSIGNFTFEYCTSLTSINIPSGVTSIGDYAFRYCSGLTSINIPSGVTYIGNRAFYDCYSLTSIDIPNSVTSIGNYAFYYCSGLTSITVNAITPPTLGSSAFSNTNDCPIYVPCDNLVNYLYASGWDEYQNRIHGIPPCSEPSIPSKFYAEYNNGTSYSADCNSSSELTTATTKPSGYQYTAMTSAEIGDCITSIGDYAFYECYSLTNIDIPNSVTSIGDYAFRYCSSLTSCTIGSGVTSIGEFAFIYCSGLTSIDIPNSVTSIGLFTFNGCSSLTSCTIGSGVTYIGIGAFIYCSGLTSIDIPNSVTGINTSAFTNCYSLTSITVNAITPPTLGSSAFSNTNDCPIYVPSSSVNTYKSASGWKSWASRIQAIPT